MSEHSEKNPDKLNTVGIVTVGLAGSAMVYIAIIGIQALYQNETSQVDEVAKFGHQGDIRDSLKAEQMGRLNEPGPRQGATGIGGVQLNVIPIEAAKALIVSDAKNDPANLIPAVSRSEFTTVKAMYGRPVTLPGPLAIGLSAAPVEPVAPAPVDGVAPAGGTEPPASPEAAPAPAPAAPTPAPGGPR